MIFLCDKGLRIRESGFFAPPGSFFVIRSIVRCRSVYSVETRRTLFFIRAYSRLQPVMNAQQTRMARIFGMGYWFLTNMKA